jgi:ubiquinone/menaquinone biosynthesis C-methylase UbiE
MKVYGLIINLYFHINSKNIHGCDIQTWGPYQSDKSSLGIEFTTIINNKLNYKKNTFHFISSIFNLHHVKELSSFIKEIYRILKPGGIFILIEHDVLHDFDRMLLDIEHQLYSCIYDKRKDYIENPDYMHLFNRFEWRYLLESHGFKYQMDSIVSFHTERKVRYDNVFYMILKK